MLILTRRIGESIIVGTDKEKIKITLLSTKGGQSKIGIKASDKVYVHREEIYKKIQKETQQTEGQTDTDQ